MRQAMSVLAVLLIASIEVIPARATSWLETTQADFADGRFNTNLYAAKDSIGGVAGDGAVRMAGNCLDIDGDGFLDLVISNGATDSLEGSTYRLYHDICSYVYWGPEFRFEERCSLQTREGVGNAIADLDNDGLLDIVFSNGSTEIARLHTINGQVVNSGRDIASYIYRNVGNRQFVLSDSLFTHSAHGLSTADLNNDGYLDLVFSSVTTNLDTAYNPDLGDSVGGPNTFSYVYYGPDFDFVLPLDSLYTHGAKGNTIADLNGDSNLDIVFSNNTFAIAEPVPEIPNSYIYWGAPKGSPPYFGFPTRSTPRTQRARSNGVADLNQDGYLDIVFSNSDPDTTSPIVHSYVFWGPEYSNTERTSLPSRDARGNCIADLDRDGWLDILFSSVDDTLSRIFWGSPTGFHDADTSLIPSIGARGNMIVDLDTNGYYEILICNTGLQGENIDTLSSIFAQDTVDLRRFHLWKTLPTHGADMSTDLDLGDVYNRADSSIYESSVFDAGARASWTRAAWSGAEPPSTWIHLFLRGGNWPSPGYRWTGWYPVDNGADPPAALDTCRYLQYRAALGTRWYLATPILRQVEIEYQTTGVEGPGQGNQPPRAFALLGGRPNPFGEATEVVLELPVAVNRLSLRVYNLAGQLVRVLADGPREAGIHRIRWDGKDEHGRAIAAGVYVCRMQADLWDTTRQVVRIR